MLPEKVADLSWQGEYTEKILSAGLASLPKAIVGTMWERCGSDVGATPTSRLKPLIRDVGIAPTNRFSIDYVG